MNDLNKTLWKRWFRQINKFRAHQESNDNTDNIIELDSFKGRYNTVNLKKAA